MEINGITHVLSGKGCSIQTQGEKIWLVFIRNQNLSTVYKLLEAVQNRSLEEKVFAILKEKAIGQSIDTEVDWMFGINDLSILSRFGVRSFPWFVFIDNSKTVYSSDKFPSFPLSPPVLSLKNSPKPSDKKQENNIYTRLDLINDDIYTEKKELSRILGIDRKPKHTCKFSKPLEDCRNQIKALKAKLKEQKLEISRLNNLVNPNDQAETVPNLVKRFSEPDKAKSQHRHFVSFGRLIHKESLKTNPQKHYSVPRNIFQSKKFPSLRFP